MSQTESNFQNIYIPRCWDDHYLLTSQHCLVISSQGNIKNGIYIESSFKNGFAQQPRDQSIYNQYLAIMKISYFPVLSCQVAFNPTYHINNVSDDSSFKLHQRITHRYHYIIVAVCRSNHPYKLSYQFSNVSYALSGALRQL